MESKPTMIILLQTSSCEIVNILCRYIRNSKMLQNCFLSVRYLLSLFVTASLPQCTAGNSLLHIDDVILFFCGQNINLRSLAQYTKFRNFKLFWTYFFFLFCLFCLKKVQYALINMSLSCKLKSLTSSNLISTMSNCFNTSASVETCQK